MHNADGYDEEGRLRRKEVVTEQIRKWHPDRFEARFLGKVPDARGEGQRVRRGAGLAVRPLTELLGKTNPIQPITVTTIEAARSPDGIEGVGLGVRRA